MNKEICLIFNEGRKYVDMGRDVFCIVMVKESCLIVEGDVFFRVDFCESFLFFIKGKRNFVFERNMLFRVVGNENFLMFDMGERNFYLGRDVFFRIISKEGFFLYEKEMFDYEDVRVLLIFNKERKYYVINRDVLFSIIVVE